MKLNECNAHQKKAYANILHTVSKMEQFAKQLYDYWFVQFDFPDKDGRPYKTAGGRMVWSPQLKREIPFSWSTDQLKNLVAEAGVSIPVSLRGSLFLSVR